LRTASLLAGYFLRRHFNDFTCKECGALAQRLIERGLRLGHFKEVPALGGRVIYHVHSSGLYAALGDDGNRNRRDHQPDTIRRRLMALDQALQNSGVVWLLTLHEKVDYFEKLQIDKANLPSSVFGGTPVPFADKQPLWLTAAGTPSFGFIDGGFRTLSHWELFLKGHRALLQQLDSAEVVFASCRQERFGQAERLFRSTVAGEVSTGGVDVVRLKKFFASRKLFDEKRYESFDQSRLDELREDKRVFAGTEFDRLYASWSARGDSELFGLRQSRLVFRTALLPQAYEWLSPIRVHERRA
jgi:hypothetical protein